MVERALSRFMQLAVNCLIRYRLVAGIDGVEPVRDEAVGSDLEACQRGGSGRDRDVGGGHS